MKRIPYGLANFEAVKEHNACYYVDKTRYIELLENNAGQFIFFLRPRRFGKTLFLSMLEHYYDTRRAHQFDDLFGDTHIGKNPTPLKNSLPILRLNFSGIPTDKDTHFTEEAFNLKVKRAIHTFYVFYPQAGGEDRFEKDFANITNATSLLSEFIGIMYERGVKYYLLIDEYDNFANNILIYHGKERYMRVTHQSGFLRSFFAAIKNATELRTVDRMFATGVSPLVLSDVTSGMNIGDNISYKIQFNAMVGFTRAEVEEMLDYYIAQKAVKAGQRSEILDIFGVNYDNYCFSENTDERIFNSDMILYFFNSYFQEGKIPSNLMDENVRIDYGKLQFLIMEERKLNGNFSILSDIIEKQEIETNLVHSFALKDIVAEEKFKSFLYYLGLLTIKSHVFGKNFKLNIPNETIKEMHFDYIRRGLESGYDLKINTSLLYSEFKKTAFEGRWAGLFAHILDKFYEAVSLRDFIYREEGIKMFMLAYLNVTPLYFVESEPEMAGGYADIFLRKNYFTTDLTQYEYLIELKYIKGEKQPPLDRIKAEAIAQLERYGKTRKITCKLKKLIIICSAQKVELIEEV